MYISKKKKTTQHSKHKAHGTWSHHFMANRWGSNGNGGSLYFLGLLTLCSWAPCLLHMAGTLMTPAQSTAAVSTPHPSSLQNLLLGLCFSQASSSSVYSRHLFLVCSASARSIPFLSFIVAIFAGASLGAQMVKRLPAM